MKTGENDARAVREYGDYQTPPSFADRICRHLHDKRGIRPKTVLEPTCGIGNLLRSALLFDAERYVGIELNPAYCKLCAARVNDQRLIILNADIFETPLDDIPGEDLLILGNPPWATNADLSRLGSSNVPKKCNTRGLRSIEAVTGESNFDICEYIVLRLLRQFRGTNATLAMLCKTSVARRVFREMARENLAFEFFDMLGFDARKVFGVAAGACLLLTRLAPHGTGKREARTLDLECPDAAERVLVLEGDRLVPKDAEVPELGGTCALVWRQGIKHDCARVMELEEIDGRLVNGLGERVDIERELVHPLVKGSMFKFPVLDRHTKHVLVTQKKAMEDTSFIKRELPKTWAYLKRHEDKIAARRSAIWRKAPPFALFGVGEYSFAPWKVGIGGLAREPFFSVLCPDKGKPAMTDDTCYFIPFASFRQALLAMLYLNSPTVSKFLKAATFADAKRPFTKKVLAALDFEKIVAAVSLDEFQATQGRLGLEGALIPDDIEAFRKLAFRKLAF